VVLCFSFIWYCLGYPGLRSSPPFWVVELVWEAFFPGVESSSPLFDVDFMVGAELPYIREC
jgi:hypothetical protein